MSRKSPFPCRDTLALRIILPDFQTREAANKLKEKLTGADQEIFFYDGVGHAFMNKSPQPYDNLRREKRCKDFRLLGMATG